MTKPLILSTKAVACLWSTCLLSACLLSACSGEDGTGAGAGIAPGSVSMEVLGASMGETVVGTRAGTTTVTEGSIGVFLDNAEGGSDYETKHNVRYTAELKEGATVWTSNDPLFFSLSVAKVCAYYPYVDDAAYAVNTKLPLATQAYDAKYDLSYATAIPMNAKVQVANGTVEGAGSQVKFTMNHAYALLTLNFKRGNIKDDETIAKIEITATGLNASNTVDITSGTYATAQSLPNGKFTLTDEVALAKNAEVSKPVLIVPGVTAFSTVDITLTLKRLVDPTMSTTVTGITQFVQGNKYIVNLTVNGTSVDVSSVETLPWTEMTLKNTDNDSPLAPVPVP